MGCFLAFATGRDASIWIGLGAQAVPTQDVAMPLYEYQCKSCGEVVEALVGFSEHPELECEQCSGSDFERLLSVFGVDRGATAGSPSALRDCSPRFG